MNVAGAVLTLEKRPNPAHAVTHGQPATSRGHSRKGSVKSGTNERRHLHPGPPLLTYWRLVMWLQERSHRRALHAALRKGAA